MTAARQLDRVSGSETLIGGGGTLNSVNPETTDLAGIGLGSVEEQIPVFRPAE